MALAHSTRKHLAAHDKTHVVVIGATAVASLQEPDYVGEIFCNATRHIKCHEMMLMHTGIGTPDDTASLASYIASVVIGPGPQSDPPPRPSPLSPQALNWMRDYAWRRDVRTFMAEVESQRPSPAVRCVVVVTDPAGFAAATGHDIPYLGLCSADISRPHSSRPRMDRLHSEFFMPRPVRRQARS